MRKEFSLLHWLTTTQSLLLLRLGMSGRQLPTTWIRSIERVRHEPPTQNAREQVALRTVLVLRLLHLEVHRRLRVLVLLHRATVVANQQYCASS